MTADQRRRAALVICGNAADQAEARELLAMCGLLPGQETWVAVADLSELESLFPKIGGGRWGG